LSKKQTAAYCQILLDHGMIDHDGNGWRILPAGEAAIPQLYECVRERRLLSALGLGDSAKRGKIRRRVSVRDRYAVLAAGACAACGRTPLEHGVVLHVDHIVPVSQGGGNERDNLQALCWACNMGKSDIHAP
jgi:5-methylcytosine-specific restriction endonuclease McrA